MDLLGARAVPFADVEATATVLGKFLFQVRRRFFARDEQIITLFLGEGTIMCTNVPTKFSQSSGSLTLFLLIVVS